MSGMTIQQKAQFIKDVELAAIAHGSESRLNGATAEQIREWAENVRYNVRKENISFIRRKLEEMSAAGTHTTPIHVNAIGVMSDPVPGYLPKERNTQYLQEKLELFLRESGEHPPASSS